MAPIALDAFLRDGGTSTAALEALDRRARQQADKKELKIEVAAAEKAAAKRARELVMEQNEEPARRAAKLARAADKAGEEWAQRERARRRAERDAAAAQPAVVEARAPPQSGGAPAAAGAAAAGPAEQPQKQQHKKRATFTWARDRAPGIFAYLHPRILNGDSKEAALWVGCSENTFTSWLKRDGKGANFIPQWFSLVHEMTFDTFAQRWPKKAAACLAKDPSLKGTHVRAKLEAYRIYSTSSQPVIGVSAAGASASAKGKLVRLGVVKVASLQGRARKHMQHQHKGKPLKWAEEEKLAVDYMNHRWNSGDPCSREHVYQYLRRTLSTSSDFFKSFLAAGTPAAKRAGWLSSVMARANLAVRKQSVSQKVPDDWDALARRWTAETVQQFKDFGVEIIVNADQTFLTFVHESKYVIAPKGAKRVGGIVNPGDDKTGCTWMVVCDTRGEVKGPFLVMTGQAGARLDGQWGRYHGKAHVCFQKKHWFDSGITVRFLAWLMREYPGQKIGLIWDSAPQHDSMDTELREFIEGESERLCIATIPKGMTSVLQVCDIALNAPLKKRVMYKYQEWRDAALSEVGVEGGQRKLKVTREDVVRWTEEVTQEMNDKLKASEDNFVSRTFLNVGQNAFRAEASKAGLERHIEDLKGSASYMAIAEKVEEKVLEAQKALAVKGVLEDRLLEAQQALQISAELDGERAEPRFQAEGHVGASGGRSVEPSVASAPAPASALGGGL